MKYKPDKTTRILARLSIILMACFGAVVFYFAFKARLNMASYSDEIAWIQLGLGATVVALVIWMAISMFEDEGNDRKKDTTNNDKNNSL
jgi:heme A synthase